MTDTFDCIEVAGVEPGPTVTILGGIHGDEEEGVLAVQRVLQALETEPLRRGVVRAVPVAHPAAYAAFARISPLDGGNLARSFPGSPVGTPTERIAWSLTRKVIEGSNLLIDLHSAGRDYAMPHYAGYVDSRDEVGRLAQRAAERFGAPLIWEHPAPMTEGRSISAAYALGIPAIYVEGSGGGSLEEMELESYVAGVLDLLADLEMLDREPRPLQPRIVLRGGGGDLDAGMVAEYTGRFIANCAAGEVLRAGQTIGRVLDLDGRAVQEVLAPNRVAVMFLRRNARVHTGDVLCALAQIEN